MKVVRRRIAPGRHWGVWWQQSRWLVIDLGRHRFEVIWR